MIYFECNESYPFTFFCNASGDLFLPAPEDQDEIDVTQLPYPLQGIYERYWGESYRWLAYLVRCGNEYGLMMEQEFSEDAGATNYEERMEALFQNMIGRGANIERALSVFCPKAEVYLGNMSGCDDCHEFCVFIPASATGDEIRDAIYLLNYSDLHEVLPSRKGQLYTDEYWDFMKKYSNFSAACGIHGAYADKPTTTIGFQDGDEMFSIRVVTSEMGDVKTAPDRLARAIQNIRTAAQAFHAAPDAEAIITRACNAVFPMAWEFVADKYVFVLDVRQPGDNAN